MNEDSIFYGIETTEIPPGNPGNGDPGGSGSTSGSGGN